MFNTLGCMPHPIRRPQKYAPSARTSAGLKKSARALAVVAFGGRPRGNDDAIMTRMMLMRMMMRMMMINNMYCVSRFVCV